MLRRTKCAIAGIAASLILASPLSVAALYAQTAPRDGAQSQITRLVARVVSAPTDATVRGFLAAIDASGQPVADLEARGTQATLDGQTIDLKLGTERPRLAIAVALVLDASTSQQARNALASGVAEGLQSLDVSRDEAAIVSTTDRRS